MVEKSNIINDKVLAEEMAYKEKPYRDLAGEVKRIHDRSGMANAFSTIIDVARHTAELYQEEIPFNEWTRNPRTLPEGQRHIADASHAYVTVENREAPLSSEVNVVVYNELNYEAGHPTVAGRANEILALWGADGEFGREEFYSTRIGDVQLQVQDHLGAVTIFAAPKLPMSGGNVQV